MGKVLEEYKLAGLNQEETDDSTDQFLFCSEHDFLIKKSSQQRKVQFDDCTVEFYQTFKELISSFLKLPRIIEEEYFLFYLATISVL